MTEKELQAALEWVAFLGQGAAGMFPIHERATRGYHIKVQEVESMLVELLGRAVGEAEEKIPEETS